MIEKKSSTEQNLTLEKLKKKKNLLSSGHTYHKTITTKIVFLYPVPIDTCSCFIPNKAYSPDGNAYNCFLFSPLAHAPHLNITCNNIVFPHAILSSHLNKTRTFCSGKLENGMHRWKIDGTICTIVCIISCSFSEEVSENMCHYIKRVFSVKKFSFRRMFNVCWVDAFFFSLKQMEIKIWIKRNKKLFIVQLVQLKISNSKVWLCWLIESLIWRKIGKLIDVCVTGSWFCTLSCICDCIFIKKKQFRMVTKNAINSCKFLYQCQCLSVFI